MREANLKANRTPQGLPGPGLRGLSRPSPGIPGRCTVQHATHRGPVLSNAQCTGVCELNQQRLQPSRRPETANIY